MKHFLTDSCKYINNHLMLFYIWKRHSSSLPAPYYFCFTGEGSTTAVNITDIIYFLLYICSFLRANDKRKRFSFVLPLFLIKSPLPCREGWELEKHSYSGLQTEDISYKTGHLDMYFLFVIPELLIKTWCKCSSLSQLCL